MLRAVLVALVSLAGLPAVGAGNCPEPIRSASYEGETGRYPHGVLGDALEWDRLVVECGDRTLSVTLPEELVFEDLAPRLADLDGDGNPEVITVESHQRRGARLAVWGVDEDGFGRLADTPFIGTRFRWLAPVGAADLDGDGAVEIAYIDRPHLAKTLRVWRWTEGRLTEVATAQGFTNHRIGEGFISGGIRHCAGQPEMVLASGDWTRLVAVTLSGGRLAATDLGPFRDRAGFDAALSCN